MTHHSGTVLDFTTPKKTDFVSGQLRTEICSTAKKTKRVIINMAAKDKKQTELIRKLKEQIFELKSEITKSSTDKKMVERLLETSERKLELETKRVVDLEQKLLDAKKRECCLNNEIKLSSDKLTELNESISLKMFEYEQHVAKYKQELLSKDCAFQKLKRELQNSETVNANLRQQILKIKEAEKQHSADHDNAALSSIDYEKQCEAVSKEFKMMEQENLKRWEKERCQLEQEFQERTVSLEVKCAEKDAMLKQKELAFEDFKVEQESVLTDMKADMEDLRSELSNQIKINGKLKHTYEDLRIGTDLKIRSLERRMECFGKFNLLMPSNSEDIERIKQILAIGCSETDLTLKRESSPSTPMPSIQNPEVMSILSKPIMINLQPRQSTVTWRNSPEFNCSVRSTLQKKRAFEEDECMTGNSKRRRHTIDCTHGGQNSKGNEVQMYDSMNYSCAVM